MDVTILADGDIIRLEVKGKLDSNTSDKFDETLDAQLSAKPKAMAIDFAGLEYMSSAGLRCLLVAAKRARAEEIGLSLYALRSNVLEIFEMSGLLKVFSIHSDREAALAALA